MTVSPLVVLVWLVTFVGGLELWIVVLGWVRGGGGAVGVMPGLAGWVCLRGSGCQSALRT